MRGRPDPVRPRLQADRWPGGRRSGGQWATRLGPEPAIAGCWLTIGPGPGLVAVSQQPHRLWAHGYRGVGASMVMTSRPQVAGW